MRVCLVWGGRDERVEGGFPRSKRRRPGTPCAQYSRPSAASSDHQSAALQQGREGRPSAPSDVSLQADRQQASEGQQSASSRGRRETTRWGVLEGQPRAASREDLELALQQVRRILQGATSEEHREETPQQGSEHQPSEACVVARVARPGEQIRPNVGFLSPSRPQHAHRHTPIRTLMEMEKVCSALRRQGLSSRPHAAVREPSGSARQQGLRGRPSIAGKEIR